MVLSIPTLIFGTTYKPEEKRIVEALCPQIIKTKEDPDGNAYPDRMQIKLHRSTDDSNKPAAGVYTDTRKPVEINNFDDLIDAIPKGTMVRVIFTPRVWFVSGKFGVSLSVKQVQIKPSASSRLTECAFSGSAPPSSEVSEEEKQVANSDEEVADSDEEVADSGEEVEEVVAEEESD